MKGKECGVAVCLESGIRKGYYLTTMEDTRLVWREVDGLTHHSQVIGQVKGGLYITLYL